MNYIETNNGVTWTTTTLERLGSTQHMERNGILNCLTDECDLFLSCVDGMILEKYIKYINIIRSTASGIVLVSIP